MKYIIGFDTSCYTTSMAVVDLEGNIVLNEQKLLPVERGQRGIRQSKALFEHLHNLPEVTEKVGRIVSPYDVAAICASTKPRPIEGSYMPVFMVSSLVGSSYANLLNIPFFETTHQESHIMAGLYTAAGLTSDHFIAIHLSGGTSEMLDVRVEEEGFSISIIGNTQDLHAGQFVDRVGVALGMPFPAGPALEELARNGREGEIIIPSFVRDTIIGFSGSETCAMRMINSGKNPADIALGVYACLSKTLEKWIIKGIDKSGVKDVLLVGGVASSNILRCRLTSRLNKINRDIRLYFADPSVSKDSAVGTALLGLKKYKRKRG